MVLRMFRPDGKGKTSDKPSAMRRVPKRSAPVVELRFLLSHYNNEPLMFSFRNSSFGSSGHPWDRLSRDTVILHTSSRPNPLLPAGNASPPTASWMSRQKKDVSETFVAASIHRLRCASCTASISTTRLAHFFCSFDVRSSRNPTEWKFSSAA